MANQQQLNPNYADTLVNGTFEFYETKLKHQMIFLTILLSYMSI